MQGELERQAAQDRRPPGLTTVGDQQRDAEGGVVGGDVAQVVVVVDAERPDGRVESCGASAISAASTKL